jgi:hypothetical protein
MSDQAIDGQQQPSRGVSYRPRRRTETVPARSWGSSSNSPHQGCLDFVASPNTMASRAESSGPMDFGLHTRLLRSTHAPTASGMLPRPMFTLHHSMSSVHRWTIMIAPVRFWNAPMPECAKDVIRDATQWPSHTRCRNWSYSRSSQEHTPPSGGRAPRSCHCDLSDAFTAFKSRPGDRDPCTAAANSQCSHTLRRPLILEDVLQAVRAARLLPRAGVYATGRPR